MLPNGRGKTKVCCSCNSNCPPGGDDRDDPALRGAIDPVTNKEYSISALQVQINTNIWQKNINREIPFEGQSLTAKGSLSDGLSLTGYRKEKTFWIVTTRCTSTFETDLFFAPMPDADLGAQPPFYLAPGERRIDYKFSVATSHAKVTVRVHRYVWPRPRHIRSL